MAKKQREEDSMFMDILISTTAHIFRIESEMKKAYKSCKNNIQRAKLIGDAITFHDSIRRITVKKIRRK